MFIVVCLKKITQWRKSDKFTISFSASVYMMEIFSLKVFKPKTYSFVSFAFWLENK